MNAAHFILFDFLTGASDSDIAGIIIGRQVWRRKTKLWSDYENEEPELPKEPPPKIVDPEAVFVGALREMAAEWEAVKALGDIQSLSGVGMRKTRSKRRYH